MTVATLMCNRYERHQHQRLCVKLGFGEPWIAAVEELAPDTAPYLSDEERAVQRLVIAMVERKGIGVSGEVENVIDLVGTEQAMAVMFLVGRYITHALIVNSLELEPPVPSIFAAEAK